MDQVDAIGVIYEIPSYAPDEEKRHMLESARRQLGNNIFKFLWEHKHPVVMDVEEIITNGQETKTQDGKYYLVPMDIIEYRVHACSVDHIHVNIMSPSQEFNLNWKQLSTFDKILDILGIKNA